MSADATTPFVWDPEDRPRGPILAEHYWFDSQLFANDLRRCQDCFGAATCRCYDPEDDTVALSKALDKELRVGTAGVPFNDVRKVVALLAEWGWSITPVST